MYKFNYKNSTFKEKKGLAFFCFPLNSICTQESEFGQGSLNDLN